MAAAIIPEGIQDDKAQHVIPFILDLLKRHEQKHAAHGTSTNTISPPLTVGLTAPQGAGKSLLVSLLHNSLTNSHKLPTTIFSLDDFYLPHDELKSLAEQNPDNPLLQHRGQPSTHDIPLVRSVFASLRENKPTKIPHFNKAAHNGHGDRVPESEWLNVNTDPAHPIRIILFEGWCVGFRPLDSSIVEQKHESAVSAARDPSSEYRGRLGHNASKSISTINEALKSYDAITSQFDGLIHIDAEDPHYVYEWRLEQEHNLIKAKGSGMTDVEVNNFVDGYFPSYELYVEGLRGGVFRSFMEDARAAADEDKDRDWEGRQLRLVVGRDRKVKRVERI